MLMILPFVLLVLHQCKHWLVWSIELAVLILMSAENYFWVVVLLYTAALFIAYCSSLHLFTDIRLVRGLH